MKRIFLLASFLSLIATFSAPSLLSQMQDRALSEKGISFRDRAVNDVRIVEERLYVATKGDLYCSKDNARSWDPLLSLARSSNEIHCIAAAGLREIYAGTRKGLFKSEDGGATWRPVFRTITPEKSDILSIAVSDTARNRVLIGTRRGVFLSEDGGKGWDDISHVLKDRAVTAVAVCEPFLYAGGEGGFYVTGDQGRHWERAFVKTGAKEEAPSTEGIEAPEEVEAESEARSLATDGRSVYLGFDRVIYHAARDGSGWTVLEGGNPGGRINCLLASPRTGKLFAATARGVSEYLDREARWEALPAPFQDISVNRIGFASDAEDLLWAASDKGFFQIETAGAMARRRSEVENRTREVFQTFDNEPAFRDLQEAAIRHADVSPEKIRRWHRESRLRSFLPKVSVSCGKSSSTNAEIYTSATKDYVVMGPDDISKDLDVSFSWDLANLIWSDDQTNIDVRSRLTAQLRNDILDELRRAYYERKRILFELAMCPPKETKAKFDKQLRLEELTSTIDGLTGNYLSDHLLVARVEEEAL